MESRCGNLTGAKVFRGPALIAREGRRWLWDVYFGPLLLGRVDERKPRVEDHRGRWIRRKPLHVSGLISYLAPRPLPPLRPPRSVGSESRARALSSSTRPDAPRHALEPAAR